MKYSVSCQKAGVIVEMEGKKLATLSYHDVKKGEVYRKLIEFGVPENEIILPDYFRYLGNPFVGKLMVNTKKKTDL